MRYTNRTKPRLAESRSLATRRSIRRPVSSSPTIRSSLVEKRGSKSMLGYLLAAELYDELRRVRSLKTDAIDGILTEYERNAVHIKDVDKIADTLFDLLNDAVDVADDLLKTISGDAKRHGIR